MSYKNLNYLIEIAQQKNISRAAEKLFISQSALSIYLKKLEEELGVSLFLRQNNKVIPTPEGELFIDTARKILKLERDFFTQISSEGNHLLTFGIASEQGLAIFSKAFFEFNALYPVWRTSIIDKRSDTLISMLEEDLIDFAIVTKPYLISNTGLHTEILKDEEMVFVIPPNHPYAHLASYDYDNPPIADVTCFRHEKYAIAAPDTTDYEIIQRIFNDYQLEPDILFEINLTRQPCQMVQDGLALHIQSSFCVPRDMNILVCRPEHAYKRYVQMIYKKNRKLCKEEKLLLKCIRNGYQHWYDHVVNTYAVSQT